jgi:hypothetical protein
MKAIKKVDAMVELANNLEVKPFDAIDQAHFLAIELCGYHNAQTLVEQLEKEIENARNTRGERKINIDKILVEMFANNVVMIRGTGMSKCPIRIELTKVLTQEKIAKGTRDNILTAISYSLHKKKPYNIHFQDDIKAEREAIVKQLENDYLVECIKRKQDAGDAGVDNYFIAMNSNVAERAIVEQWDDKEKKYWIDAHKKIQADTLEKIKTVATAPASEPPASEPPASEPPASEPPASEPPASEPPASEPPTKKNSRREYMVDTRKLMETLHGATELRRCFNDSDKVYYENILGAISTIMDNLKTMALDKDVASVIGDMQENDDFDDDNLDIDTELVD